MLLDGNVVSEIWKTHGDQRVKRAVRDLSGQLRISTITIGELYFGIQKLEPGRKRDALLENYAGLKAQYEGNALLVTAEVAETWGELGARLRRIGRPRPIADTLIAATALVHDLTLMTRNTRGFADTGVRLFNPWEG